LRCSAAPPWVSSRSRAPSCKAEDPVETVKKLSGVGVDRVIDAVGVDAMHAHHGPAGEQAQAKEQKFAQEVQQVAPERHPHDDGTSTPGDGPSQALQWAVESLPRPARSASSASILQRPSFPIGKAMNKNLSTNAGNCNHRAYIPKLVEMVRTGVIDPVKVLAKVQPLTDGIEAHARFDKREAGWIKTELKLAQAAE
jgi:threonine dehydrogenase-like Zn-dependent dehydrogenase